MPENPVVNDKKTCGEYYREAFQKYGENNPMHELCFAAGFISGQAEKVFIGACTAAMFRPSEESKRMVNEILSDVLPRYGLVSQWIYDEVWICKPENYARVHGMLQFIVNSNFWHRIRGQLCGVPHEDMDLEFHKRKGYAEKCD